MIWQFYCALLLVWRACVLADEYSESLTFDRLLNGDLIYVMEVRNLFNETILSRGKPTSVTGDHQGFWTDLFPLELLYLVTYYGVAAFDLSLTHGAWQGHHWGLPFMSGICRPSGAHLFALFDASFEHNASTRST
jgi:hypothetical protein